MNSRHLRIGFVGLTALSGEAGCAETQLPAVMDSPLQCRRLPRTSQEWIYHGYATVVLAVVQVLRKQLARSAAVRGGEDNLPPTVGESGALVVGAKFVAKVRGKAAGDDGETVNAGAIGQEVVDGRVVGAVGQSDIVAADGAARGDGTRTWPDLRN